MEFITDRTQLDIDYLKSLILRGWDDLTTDEKNYYLGLFTEEVLITFDDDILYTSDNKQLLVLGGSDICKGAYNYKDFNRVENNIILLRDLILTIGFHVTITEKGSQWEIEDIPTSSDISRLLTNIENLRNEFYTLITMPVTPSSMEKMSYEKANDIEQILKNINYIYNIIIRTEYKYAGTFYAGNEGGLI